MHNLNQQSFSKMALLNSRNSEVEESLRECTLPSRFDCNLAM